MNEGMTSYHFGKPYWQMDSDELEDCKDILTSHIGSAEYAGIEEYLTREISKINHELLTRIEIET